MSKCAQCKIDYPNGVELSPISFGGKDIGELSITGEVCGICALEITNKIHGVKQTSFQGRMAEENRQAAIRYRKSIGR